ncbi:hypothetical protein LguiB_029590 [Lonicera macranthoides]
MKKFFFFKSSSSSNSDNNPSPPSDGEMKNQATDKSRTKNQVYENQTSGSSPSLRRSRSYSSGSAYDAQRNLSCLNNQSGSPCSSSNNVSLKRLDPCSSRRTLTPERQPKAKWFQEEKLHCVPSSKVQNDSSESSSNCSSNVSSKVLDRFIDGEQQEERSKLKSNSSLRNHIGKRPPRVQYTVAGSPTNGKQKPKSHSFREMKGTHLHFSTGEWVENGFRHESPRKLAKHVIERLSQSRPMPKASLKEFDPDVPITIEDIYGVSLNRSSSVDLEDIFDRNCPFGGPDETTSEDHPKEISFGTEEDIDAELRRKSEEMKEWAMFLSDELDHKNFVQAGAFSVSTLVQRVRNLTEEKIHMALEVSSVLEDRMAERALAREDLRAAKAELESRTRRLEREKNELQSALEKELDRRSSEWSFKLEKYQAEEHRLRERVRELAEQNVALQREVSSFSERDMDSRTRLTHLESQLKEVGDENQNLQKNVSELQESHRAAEEDRDCFRRNYEEKEKECKDLQRSIMRLVRTCSEQEKMICGLREGLGEEIRKKNSPENLDDRLGKLQMEQMRLTRVEQTLRKEVESCRHEVDSLRHENINLLHRLKAGGMEVRSTFKLDQELWDRVHCLEKQGLSLLNESTQLSCKLLEFIKAQASIDGQFVVESDMKIQGFKRGAESLVRSLQNVSVVLEEKSALRDGSVQLNGQSSEDIIRSELKAETLLTSLLREKLYSKEMDLEQLQAEVAAAVRGNDILRCEVENAMDSLSCVIHKMKDLELQMIKKDENINWLKNDLQECSKELTIMRGILPKISEERDLMWEEVKQYSEKTMLLNSQVDAQKRKIEALDEDILLKEGQITILKDTIGKPFDFLGSPDRSREFVLER